ncbi:MAG: hypothetical protein KC481_22400, partial [Acidimicrobiaceae bacterium]|nr:hypothetical protein [Acidimicrobiaceae bacterium]
MASAFRICLALAVATNLLFISQAYAQEDETSDPFNSDAALQDTAVVEFTASAEFVADFVAVF